MRRHIKKTHQNQIEQKSGIKNVRLNETETLMSMCIINDLFKQIVAEKQLAGRCSKVVRKLRTVT